MIDGKILITGSNGQLGQCLHSSIKYYGCKIENYLFTTREEFDIGNTEMMRKYLSEHKDVKVIINCAAYTNVKGAETDDGFKQAMFINCECVKNLARLCNEFGIFLIHFGTDYMYNYDKINGLPIGEDCIHWEFSDDYFYKYYSDKKNRYGYSKCAGIHEIFKEFKYTTDDKQPKFVILVVSWLYSIYGKNFVKTIRERVKSEEKTNVVYTQVGSPTYANDLADYIIDVIENDNCKFVDNPYGYNIESTFDSSYWHIINFANLGVASWYDIAKKVEEIFSIHDKIEPILEVDDSVLRPKYSVLNTSRLFRLKGDKRYVRHWLEALYDCCSTLRFYEKNKKETD